MSENREGMDRGSNEPASHHKTGSRKSGWKIPGVNFDEMNYEQRRVPYNHSHKNSPDKEMEADRRGNHPSPRAESC